MNYIRARQSIDNQDICLSGGALGAHIEWGTAASNSAHAALHWSFPSHKTPAPETQVTRLSDEELSIADPFLEDAARVLGKSPPRRSNIKRLFQRNYFQVAWAEMCFAVTAIQNKADSEAKIGGTAWAATMFAQLHPQNPHLYLFRQEKSQWFQWVQTGNGEDGDGEWEAI